MATSRSETYTLARSDSSWLIPYGGDIDKWRWLPERSFAFPAVIGDRNFAKNERTWRLVHMDLRVGPLGGFRSAAVHPDEASAACAGCRAPLFIGETRTKCCFIGGASRSGWCGPFCSFPYIPRPTAEAVNKHISRKYGSLWYGDDEVSKYFRANTRLFNSRYVFSSLRRTCVRPTHAQSAGLAERPRAMAHECRIYASLAMACTLHMFGRTSSFREQHCLHGMDVRLSLCHCLQCFTVLW